MNLKSGLAIAIVGAASLGHANLLVNGSFELGTDPGTFSTVGVGGTDITGWDVVTENVDYIGSYWQASDGVRSVDLNGSNGSNPKGAIAQTFATTAGTLYKLTLDYAGNPDGEPPIKGLYASVDGNYGTLSFDVTGKSLSNMGWLSAIGYWVADDSSATLELGSLYDGYFGPAIDNVSVEAVPEPATMAVLALGAGIAARKRRNK